MKQFIYGLFVVLTISQVNSFADNVTMLQYFYTAKKVLPEATEISVMIPADAVENEKSKIGKAAARMKIKVKLYVINDVQDISKELKNINDKSLVLVYNSPMLMNNTNRSYILSVCKEKQIAVISSSNEYTRAGAMIGLAPGADKKLQLIVNLTNTPHLSGNFTPDFIQKIGAEQVIR